MLLMIVFDGYFFIFNDKQLLLDCQFLSNK